jgi:hypothetical protein
VQPGVPDARRLQQARPVVVVGLLGDRPAVGLGNDHILVVPFRAGQHPLPELGGLVLVRLSDGRQGEGQRAVAALALGLLVDQPATPEAVDAAPDRQGVVERSPSCPDQSDPSGSFADEPTALGDVPSSPHGAICASHGRSGDFASALSIGLVASTACPRLAAEPLPWRTLAGTADKLGSTRFY